ncbi:signal peptidase II [candidate division KSB1 bacterium]|nr:signal peptidase II [candidate division KSB1 bacterium]
MASLPKFYLIVLILFTSMGFDQVSKNIAKSSLENSPPMSYLGETFRLQYAENTGSFLSLGSGLSKTTRFLLFTFLSGGLLIALFFYTIKSRDLQRKHIFALSLILGGGASNMIDRIVNDGKVIDFMNMGIGSLRTGIFNMADVLIMVGIAFILLFNFQSHKEKRSPSEDTESTQSKSAS